MKRSHFIIAIVAACLLTSGLTAFAVSKLVSREGEVKPVHAVDFRTGGAGTQFTAWNKDGYPDLTYAAENAVKAVVNIENIQERSGGSYNPLYEFFGVPDGYGQGPTRQVRSGGSGVIISPDGYIVTNNHVIENASELKVKLFDNRMFDATIVGSDPSTDVALIKIDAEDLPTLTFGDSDGLRLGEWVLAIGSPFDLQSTITAGIVSAKGRNLHSYGDNGKMDIQSFIQTDAAVNMGNSGGALVNTRGELVGINTALTSPTGTFAGYSFAVPVSIVQKVVMDLKEYGVVQRAMIGISFIEINPESLEQMERIDEPLDTRETEGLYVAELVPGGGGEAAGLQAGDVIIEIDGTRTTSGPAFQEYVAKRRPNDKVSLTVKRDGKVKHFDVVLRNMAGKAEPLTKDTVFATEVLGGTFADVSARAARELKIDGGVVVRSVEPGGLMSKNRIRRGFIITAINETPIRTVNDLRKFTGTIESVEGVYPDRGYASYFFGRSDE